jgi:competence protein ComEA
MFKNDWFKSIFHFTHKDRIFIFLVTAIIGGSLTLPRIVAPSPPPLSLLQDSVLVLAMDTLQQQQVRKKNIGKGDYNTAYPFERTRTRGFTDAELFPFDPNVLTAEEWQRLGLNAKTSKTIINYVSKGGKFYKPEDLQKIWGLPEGFYDRVKEYIRITTVQKNFLQQSNNKSALAREERKPVVIDINEADTADLIALPGIGTKLSARIISFREKLGGFYSVDQIGETYGLPDSTFQKIKARLQTNGSGVRKININTATKDDLKMHPYIRWNLANAIVEYRNQHGEFKEVEELKKIVLVDDETFRKIVPYLGL